MKQTSRGQTGFTIVELLIVIVVIGILAAITIVAFNGVQQRARATTIKSDLRTVANHIAAYNAEKGEYPDTATELGQAVPKNSFTKNPDPYFYVLYCTDGTNFIISGRPTGTTNHLRVGSALALGETTMGHTANAATACGNLGMTSTYETWMKGGGGWTTSYWP